MLEQNAFKQYPLAQSKVYGLYAEIIPNFVYNGLDALLSLIEQQCYDKPKEMTFVLYDFSVSY
ncbi:hypothetical protein RV10_GL003170 [Enterococcus pallens]|nr:hypothetical protein RV10_GL003170 [Enterococcus pallens]